MRFLPVSTIRNLLFSSRGMSPRAQRIAQDMLRTRASFIGDLRTGMRDWRAGTPRPGLGDFPRSRAFRDLLDEIEQLAPPQPGWFDSLVVQPDDYARQAWCSRIAGDASTRITVAEAFDELLRGTPLVATGSNNTYARSEALAAEFFRTGGYPVGLKLYLAMDMAWWPSTDGIAALGEKNILAEVAFTTANDIVNGASIVNPDVAPAMTFAHSYAGFYKAAALLVFDALQIPNSRTTFFSPLGTDLLVTALIEIKNRYAGRNAIERGAWDILEDLLRIRQTLAFEDVAFDRMVTDVRLDTSSHGLGELAAAHVRARKAANLDDVGFNEAHYTTRPGRVTYGVSPDGFIEPDITPRTGPAYTMENYIEKALPLLAREAAAFRSTLESQASMLRQAARYVPPTPEMQATGKAIRDASAALAGAAPEVLPDVVRSVREVLATTGPAVAMEASAASRGATAAGDSAWESSVAALTSELHESERAIESITEERETLEEGELEPED